MSIRPATMDDIDRLIDLGEILHKESGRWSRIPYVRDRVKATMKTIIPGEKGAVFVSEKDGVIVGGIAVYADRHWSSDAVIAQEISFFMLPEHRGSFDAARLVCAMRAWAERKGVAWLECGTSTGVDPERTAKLYERLGFKRSPAIGLEVFYGS